MSGAPIPTIQLDRAAVEESPCRRDCDGGRSYCFVFGRGGLVIVIEDVKPKLGWKQDGEFVSHHQLDDEADGDFGGVE